MVTTAPRMAPEAAKSTSWRREPKGWGTGVSMTCVAVIAASVWSRTSSMALCMTVIWWAKVAREARTSLARTSSTDTSVDSRSYSRESASTWDWRSATRFS